MKTVGGRPVDTEKSEELKESKLRIDPDDLSPQQIEERASVRTEVLNAILAKQDRPSFRHWGLNE